jgi:hypothetical protein
MTGSHRDVDGGWLAYTWGELQALSEDAVAQA